MVSDHGYRLSGGEKQHLTMTRMLLSAQRSWCSTTAASSSRTLFVVLGWHLAGEHVSDCPLDIGH